MITVVMTTYDKGDHSRTNIAEESLLSMRDYLQCSQEIKWIVVDDSEYDEHALTVIQHMPETILLKSGHKGVGYAKNLALRKAFKFSDIVLLTEDDWMLETFLNLDPHIEALSDPTIGIVRLGYLGGEMTATHESYSPFYGYWRLKRGSGVYVYSGQVSLRHKRFYDAVGYHPEGVTPGNEEIDMCKKYNATEGAPDNIWPTLFGSSLNASPFKNIGMANSTNDEEPK